MSDHIEKKTPNVFEWTGRSDREDAQLGQRVHHVARNIDVNQLETNSIETRYLDKNSLLDKNRHLDKNSLNDNSLEHRDNAVSIVGFASDAGVQRNKGRIGAKAAPDLIRRALANLAWHKPSVFNDLGTVTCEGDELEVSQQRCAAIITQALKSTPVITLGGGHEVAWASFQGLAHYLQLNNDADSTLAIPRVGIINFDAHFDLRVFSDNNVHCQPSSGTPFNQISEWCKKNQWDFNYLCIGVSQTSNTAALFKKAHALGVQYILDEDCLPHNLSEHLSLLQRFIDQCDYVYLTIDLDVFPASAASGVSASAAIGISTSHFIPLFKRILSHNNKLKLADIAEYNPSLDIDNQTARLAARLCWDIADSMTDKQ